MCFFQHVSRQNIAWRTENQLLDVAPEGSNQVQGNFKYGVLIVLLQEQLSVVHSCKVELPVTMKIDEYWSARMSVKLMQKDFCKCFYVKDVSSR